MADELLALPAAPDDDADLDVAVADGPPDGGAVRRVVDRLGAVGAEVDDVVAGAAQPLDEVRLELEPRVIGGDGDPGHRGDATRPAST